MRLGGYSYEGVGLLTLNARMACPANLLLKLAIPQDINVGR